jgi:hypothetical protein
MLLYCFGSEPCIGLSSFIHDTHPNGYIICYRDGQSDGVDDAVIRYRQGVGFRRVDLQRDIHSFILASHSHTSQS